MRVLLAALILSLPLHAQDKPKDHKAEIDRVIKELEAELGKEHDAIIKKVIEHLRAIRKKGVFDKMVVDVDRNGLAGIRLMVAPGGETMQGSFDENGKKGTYTLKSSKDGKYTLEATIKDGKTGDSQVLKDLGTFADLRAKYKWLQGGVMVATTRANWGDRALWAGLKVARPVIGVRVRPPADELRHHLEIPVGGGLVVDSVAPGSRAQKLGLKKFDLLMRIDGELVEDPNQVKKLAEKGVTLEYVRRAKKKRLVTE